MRVDSSSGAIPWRNPSVLTLDQLTERKRIPRTNHPVVVDQDVRLEENERTVSAYGRR